MKSSTARLVVTGMIVTATCLSADRGASTDQHYTSSFKLSWSSHDLKQLGDSPYANPLLPLFNILPYINEKDYQKNLVFALGQNI